MIAGIVCAIILLGAGSSAIIALAQYRHAKSGLQHFKNAQAALSAVAAHPFDTTNIARAHSEFAAALQDFTQVNNSLSLLPGGLTSTPVVGSKLGGAMRLVPIAIQGARAGMIACDILAILATKLKDPLTPSVNGLTAADLATITAKYGQIRAIVDDVLVEISTLRPSDLALDPRLGPALASLHAKLPQIRQLMDDAQVFLSLAPVLLGVAKPASFLVEVLDSTELRPGGGFIGNYGLLTLSGGHLNGLHVQDVDLLDYCYHYGPCVIPLPAQYQWFYPASPSWGFRDSNLEADFPTSAQYGESLYKREGGTGDLQGVIALTPWLVQDALRITGPIAVPEFNQTVTADNMVHLIHLYQLTDAAGKNNRNDPNSGTSARKRFTGYLFQHFMAAVKDKEQSGQGLGQFVTLLTDGLRHKDLQVYLNAAPAENILRRDHLAGTIDAPPTGDSLLAVDANIVASKINYFLQYTLTDRVTLDAQGNATHQTTLSYVWPADPSTVKESFPAGYPYLYIAYLRFYVPPGAKLLSQTGWQTTSAPASAFGRTVWGGTVYVYYATHTNIAVTWREPKAATQTGTTWHYASLLQKQAGVTVKLAYTLTLPSCAKLVGAPPSGFTAPNQHTLTVTEPLTTDVPLAVDYSC